MKKIRALIIALLMASSLFIVNDVTPASAFGYSCSFSPASYVPGGTYAGANCWTNRVGGAFHAVVVTCRYYQLWSAHTYTHQGPWASDNNWSWAYCSNGDEAIHARAVFYPSDGVVNTGWW